AGKSRSELLDIIFSHSTLEQFFKPGEIAARSRLKQTSSPPRHPRRQVWGLLLQGSELDRRRCIAIDQVADFQSKTTFAGVGSGGGGGGLDAGQGGHVVRPKIPRGKF